MPLDSCPLVLFINVDKIHVSHKSCGLIKGMGNEGPTLLSLLDGPGGTPLLVVTVTRDIFLFVCVCLQRNRHATSN